MTRRGRPRRIAALLLAGGVAATLAGGQEPATPAPGRAEPGVAAPGREEPVEEGDRRVRVLVRYGCSSRLGRRELTAFANGTLRLERHRPGEEPQLELLELGPDEIDGIAARLASADLSEVGPLEPERLGGWAESCELALGRSVAPGGRPYRFSRDRTLPHGLADLVRLAEELAERVEWAPRGGGLPAGYEPAPGDVLVRADGARFELVAFTADGRGVELQGIDQPLVLYVAVAELGGEFVDVELRGWRPRGRPAEREGGGG